MGIRARKEDTNILSIQGVQTEEGNVGVFSTPTIIWNFVFLYHSLIDWMSCNAISISRIKIKALCLGINEDTTLPRRKMTSYKKILN